MNKKVCQYAVVRFAPFVETEEFANVGIVMMSPKHRFFAYKLETKKYARITHFFNEIDAKLYKNALFNLKEEMDRVSQILKPHGIDQPLKYNDVEFSNGIFEEITRPRETIIRFSQIRTVLTEDLDKKLKELYAYYVERNFVTKKYQEALLEKSVRKILSEANIGDKYTRETIGDEAYHVSFPFVQHGADYKFTKINKIIKPLYLAHDDPTKIQNHGASWIFKINKLKKKQCIQIDNVLFTLSAPDNKIGNQYEAYSEIKHALKETGAQILPIKENRKKLLEFALG